MCADGMCIGGAHWRAMAMQTDCLFEHHQSQQFKQVATIPCCFVQWVAPDYPHTARLTHPQLHLNPNGRCLLVRCVPRRLSIKCVVTLGLWPWLGLFISQRCLASGSKPPQATVPGLPHRLPHRISRHDFAFFRLGMGPALSLVSGEGIAEFCWPSGTGHALGSSRYSHAFLQDADLPIRLRHHGAPVRISPASLRRPPPAAALCSSHGSTSGTSGQAGLGQQGPERRAKNRWLKPTFCTSPI
jgi:hypothetical protein